MKLHIDGKINPYYIQTLCMMLFPGVKFAEDEEETPESTAAYVTVGTYAEGDAESGVKASVVLRHEGKEARAESRVPYSDLYTKEKCVKIAKRCHFH